MFCRYCGKEILDEAVLCPHCGVWVKDIDLPVRTKKDEAAAVEPVKPAEVAEIAEVTEVTEAAENEREKDLAKSRLLRIFGIISFAFTCVTALLVAGGLASNIYYYMGYSSSYYYPEYANEAFGFGVFTAMVALGTGIPCFVLGLKQKNASLRLLATLVFVAAVFSFILPLVCGY